MPQAVVWIGMVVLGGASFGTTLAVIGLAVSVISMAVMARQSLPKMDNAYKAPNPDAYKANKQVVRGGSVNRRIGYGEVRTGGVVAFIDTTDIKGWNREGNSDLYMAVACFPHPIQSFQNLHVNDKDLYWYQNSANWTEPKDLVTIIWHRDMDEFTDNEGDNPMWWSGTINGVRHSYPFGFQGEVFDQHMTGLGFSVTTSFVDGGTRKHIAKGEAQKKLTSTSWEPNFEYDVATKVAADIPLWNETTKSFDTVKVDLTGNDSVYALDGSNTWEWTESTPSVFPEEPDTYTTTTLERVQDPDDPDTWYYFSWNGASYDNHVSTTGDPAKTNIIDLNGKISFTDFESQPFVESEIISASIDNMPGVLDVNYYRGDLTQTVDPTLNALFPSWDASHYGRGVSYFTTHLFYDYEALPNGIPNYNVTVMGKNDIIDPRLISNAEDLSDVKAIRDRVGSYTTNPAAIILDYMISEFGLNIPLDQIELDSFAIAANICDEPLQLKSAIAATAGTRTYAPIEGYRTNIIAPAHGFTSSNESQLIQLSGANITSQVTVVDADNFTIDTGYLVEGETVTANLLQKRYTINGVVDTGTAPSAVIDSMLSHTGGGSIVYDDGLYKLSVGAYKQTTAHISEDMIVDDIKVQPRATRDQLFNAVRGTYVNRYKDFEPTDYTAWENPFYCQEDNKGEPCGTTDYIFTEMNFPYCIEPNRARRLAKIYLNRHRQALVINMTCNLSAYKIDTGDFVTVTVGDMGFINKEFEVVSWTLETQGVISLILQETAAEIYDWNDGEYVTEDLAVNSVLPLLTWPNQFQGISLNTSAYLDTSGSVVETINVEVLMDELYDYVTYADTEIEYRDVLDANDTWHVATKGKSLYASVQDVKMSLYAIRVRGTSKSAPPTQWYISQIRTQGAGSLITLVDMPKPINPIVFFSIHDSEINKISVSVDLDTTQWDGQVAYPEYLLLMYSTEEAANEIGILNNQLVMDEVEVLEEGSYAVIADAKNSINQIKLFETGDVNTAVDLAGMWWCRVKYADNSESKFTKVRWYDENYIYLARDLDVVPTAGDTLQYWSVAFHDTRADEFQLGCVFNDATEEDYEVILWDDLQWDGTKFQFIGVTRQAEDSLAIDATGKKFSYYPAPGVGTSLLVVPASSFSKIDNNTYQSVYEVDITLPTARPWGAITCMFGRNTVQNNLNVIARSPIVLTKYGGEG